MIIAAMLLGLAITASVESGFGAELSSVNFLLLVIAAVIVLAVFRPRLAVLSLAVSTPLTPEFQFAVVGISGIMLNADLILISVVLIRYLLTTGITNKDFSASELDVSVWLFVGIAVLSLLFEATSFSTEILLSMLYLAEWAAYCSIPLLIHRYVDTHYGARLFLTLMIIAASAIMLHLLARHFVFGIPTLPSGRGTFQDPLGPGSVNRLRTFWAQNSNAVGGFLAFHAVVVAGIVPKLNRWSRFLGYGFIAVSLYLIFWTFSRSAMVTAGVGIGLIAVVYRPFWSMVVGLTGSLTAAVLMPQEIFVRIWSTFRPSQYVPLPIGGLDSRLFAWIRQFMLFQEEPISGTGFHLVPETLVQAGYGGAWAPDNAHLQALVGTGIIGYLAYLGIFAVALRYAVSLTRIADEPLFIGVGIGVTGLIVGFLAGSMFYDIFGRWRLLGPLFCYIGLVIAIYGIVDANRASKGSEPTVDNRSFD